MTDLRNEILHSHCHFHSLRLIRESSDLIIDVNSSFPGSTFGNKEADGQNRSSRISLTAVVSDVIWTSESPSFLPVDMQCDLFLRFIPRLFVCMFDNRILASNRSHIVKLPLNRV